MTENKATTHIAFALKKEGRRFGRWLEIGTARLEADGNMHVFLDRTPIGGFNGYTYLSLVGVKPPDPEQLPQRPASPDSEENS